MPQAVMFLRLCLLMHQLVRKRGRVVQGVDRGFCLRTKAGTGVAAAVHKSSACSCSWAYTLMCMQAALGCHGQIVHALTMLWGCCAVVYISLDNSDSWKSFHVRDFVNAGAEYSGMDWQG
jgi:hypothetical protein